MPTSWPACYFPDLRNTETDEGGAVTFYDDGTATFRSEHYTIDVPTRAAHTLRTFGQCFRPTIVLRKH